MDRVDKTGFGGRLPLFLEQDSPRSAGLDSVWIAQVKQKNSSLKRIARIMALSIFVDRIE